MLVEIFKGDEKKSHTQGKKNRPILEVPGSQTSNRPQVWGFCVT